MNRCSTHVAISEHASCQWRIATLDLGVKKTNYILLAIPCFNFFMQEYCELQVQVFDLVWWNDSIHEPARQIQWNHCIYNELNEQNSNQAYRCGSVYQEINCSWHHISGRLWTAVVGYLTGTIGQAHHVYTTFCKTITKFCENPYQILREKTFASRIFSIVVLRTFIYPNVPILSDELPGGPTPKNYFYQGKNCGSWWACTKWEKKYQNLLKNITKIC